MKHACITQMVRLGQTLQEQQFYAYLNAYGVTSVAKVQLVFVDMEGLPGYTALLLACKYKVPTKTWVWPITCIFGQNTVWPYFVCPYFNVE